MSPCTTGFFTIRQGYAILADGVWVVQEEGVQGRSGLFPDVQQTGKLAPLSRSHVSPPSLPLPPACYRDFPYTIVTYPFQSGRTAAAVTQMGSFSKYYSCSKSKVENSESAYGSEGVSLVHDVSSTAASPTPATSTPPSSYPPVVRCMNPSVAILFHTSQLRYQP